MNNPIDQHSVSAWAARGLAGRLDVNQTAMCGLGELFTIVDGLKEMKQT